jgi:hypothetical protein
VPHWEFEVLDDLETVAIQLTQGNRGEHGVAAARAADRPDSRFFANN